MTVVKNRKDCESGPQEHGFLKIPAFDAAMRKIAAVSKEEIARREQAERDTKQASE